MVFPTDINVTRFFLAVIILLFSAHVFGYLFHRLKMPKVIGEIIGGIILGPTVLGFFLPTIYKSIFEAQASSLAILYWFGLVLLMFCSGFELQTTFDKHDKKTVIFITLASTIIPFLFGWFAVSFFDITQLMGSAQNEVALKLIIAVVIAVTSIPVISKIFMDLNLIKTAFAKIVLAIATIHDIILWIFLAIATSLVSEESLSLKNISMHVAISLLFFSIVLLIMPILLNWLGRYSSRLHITLVPEQYETGFAVLILLGFVMLADYLTINIIFGAFLAGIVISFIKSERFEKVKTEVKHFSFAFFIPMYFAIVGIKLDLLHHLDISFFLLFLLFAMLVQGVTVLITSKLLKYTWLSSFNLAIAMNARGGPGIVIATIAFDTGIINESFFITLILLAIVTSLLAGSWLRYVSQKNYPLLDKI